MRLVVDCFKLVKGKGKSIGIYNLTKSLIQNLSKRNLAIQDASLRHEILVLGNAYNEKDFKIEGVTFVRMSGNPLNKAYDVLWELFLVKGQARKAGADRILFPRGYRPLFYKGKDTVIIHDLIPFFYHREFHGVLNPIENAYIMARLKASMKHADRIITISEFSKREMNEMCPGCASRMRVIYNGVTPVSSTGAPCALKPKGPYLYAMASALPHKNALGVLKTYEAYFHAVKDPIRLVMTGLEKPEDVLGNEDGKVLSPDAASFVTCYKYIESAEDMYNLFAGASVFLFLSLIEGFGFPPLEAMQLGVPVVCSNKAALPEVVKDAGLLTDPNDIPHTVECIRRILSDENLRRDLIAKGYENAKRFDWESRTDQYWLELME